MRVSRSPRRFKYSWPLKLSDLYEWKSVKYEQKGLQRSQYFRVSGSLYAQSMLASSHRVQTGFLPSQRRFLRCKMSFRQRRDSTVGQGSRTFFDNSCTRRRHASARSPARGWVIPWMAIERPHGHWKAERRTVVTGRNLGRGGREIRRVIRAGSLAADVRTSRGQQQASGGLSGPP